MGHLDKAAVWQRTDGGISITYFDDRDKKSGETDDQLIARFVTRLKPNFGTDPVLMNVTDIPNERSERDEWSIIDEKVKVDPIKVALKEAKKAEKQAVFTKLKITEEEFRKLI